MRNNDSDCMWVVNKTTALVTLCNSVVIASQLGFVIVNTSKLQELP